MALGLSVYSDCYSNAIGYQFIPSGPLFNKFWHFMCICDVESPTQVKWNLMKLKHSA